MALEQRFWTECRVRAIFFGESTWMHLHQASGEFRKGSIFIFFDNTLESPYVMFTKFGRYTGPLGPIVGF
jgi:hypothetical protein